MSTDSVRTDSSGSPSTSSNSKQTLTVNETSDPALQGNRERILSEVQKWNEEGNDIIDLAKKMCILMVDLGKGNISRGQDTIKTVETMALQGEELIRLLNGVSVECPPGLATEDLLAYTQQIALYSHQLKFAAKLKEDDHRIKGETFVTSIDSGNPLLDIARNLTRSVIVTIRACCIASTGRSLSSSSSSPRSSSSSAPRHRSSIGSSSRSWMVNESFFDEVFD